MRQVTSASAFFRRAINVRYEFAINVADLFSISAHLFRFSRRRFWSLIKVDLDLGFDRALAIQKMISEDGFRRPTSCCYEMKTEDGFRRPSSCCYRMTGKASNEIQTISDCNVVTGNLVSNNAHLWDRRGRMPSMKSLINSLGLGIFYDQNSAHSKESI